MKTSTSLIVSDRHAHRALARTWQFRLLHIAGFALTLPGVCCARLLPGRRRDESVFAETNRAVLTALGFAFMA